MTTATDNWAAGDAYERYMGRWSRPLARSFVSWLSAPRGVDWLDVGCGTGALTRAICDLAEPASVLACDPSEAFVRYAEASLRHGRVAFVVAGAESLPGNLQAFDCAVSGLAINFVADPLGAVRRMTERLRRGGLVGVYVWDYGEGMEFLRSFWDAAVALDSAAVAFDEDRRFPLCKAEALEALFNQAGLEEVVVEGLEIPTYFQGFEDFWMPVLLGVGPAPAYAASLPPERQILLRQRLVDLLKPEIDGGIRLKARAWAVRGVQA